MVLIKYHAKVIRSDDKGTKVLAEVTSEREAESFEALRTQFESDMRTAFPQEAFADIEYFIEQK